MSKRKSEISLTEIFRILYNRKWIILSTVLLLVLLSFLYNIFKSPTYQSSVLIKKEIKSDINRNDVLGFITGGQRQDELETEMRLVKTRGVLNKTIEKLSLNILLEKIIEQDGTVTQINLPLAEYQKNYSLGNYPSFYPKINRIFLGVNTNENKFKLTKTENEIKLTDKLNNDVLTSNFQYSELSTNKWIIDLDWNNESLSEIHFETIKYNDLLKDLNNNIFTDKKIKTSIFELYVKSEYPNLTTQIANTLAEEYLQNRITLNQENIRYSFNFIDERLEDVAKNLEVAEKDLSDFKSKEKIIQIDEQSKSLVSFLSNLESEKLNTELEFGIFKNKVKDIKEQLKYEDFIDQTFLTPEQYSSFESPFKDLLRQLTNTELQKLELLQRRTEFHPDVVLLDDKIKRIKNELTNYNNNTLISFNIISNSLENKLNNIDNLINKYTGRLEKLPAQESKLASLMRKKEAFEKMYTLLLEKREEMRVADLSKLQDIVILDKAIEPIKPIAPNKFLNLAVGSLLGLFLGLFAAFIINYSDKKVNNIYDIERDFSFPILSVIPPFEKEIKSKFNTTNKVKDRFVSMMDDKFRYKEALRTLETKLVTKIKDDPKKVMITSCEENAGKTSVSANLAITIAQSGKKVLLIDCDIKNPKIADLFGLPKYSSGLIDFLTDKTDTPNIYKPIKLSDDTNLIMNIDIIPTGVFANISGEILASEKMKELMSNLAYYDFVILDTPPLTRVSDALSLGRIVKDTLLVIRARQTEKESINWAISELKTTDVNFLGTVINDCEVNDSSLRYQYGYNYKNS